MTARSSTFAWETPWAEEPGGLQSTGRTGSERLSTHRSRGAESAGTGIQVGGVS